MEEDFEFGDEVISSVENGAVTEVQGTANEEVNYSEDNFDEQTVNTEYDNQDTDNEYVEDDNDKYDAFTILQEFGSEDGMIEYGGKQIHISELTSEEQLDVTGQLFMEMKNHINNQPDFDEDELGLIAEARNNGMSLNQYLESYVEQQVQEVLKQNEINYAQSVVSDTQENIDDYSDDEIMIYHLKSLDPDITDDDLKEELETKKSSRTYDKELLKIRDDIKREQTTLVETQKQVLQKANEEQVEVLWNEGVNILQNTKTIAGFDISDMPEQMMKELLEDTIIPINENDESKLLSMIYNNSEARIKAMFFLKHEQAIVDNIAEQDRIIADFPRLLKEAETKSYQKAYSDVVKNKFPTQSNNKVSIQSKPNKPQQRAASVEDFFNE
jgi:hypothetical protein